MWVQADMKSLNINNQVILLTIFLTDGVTTNTVGRPNANARENERGHIFKKLDSKHLTMPLDNT